MKSIYPTSIRSVALALFVLFFAGNLNAQCPPPGDITLLTQADVNAFGANYPSCTMISGNLTIGPSADIVNLTGLAGIITITGTLQVNRNDLLTNLNDLSSLSTLDGGLTVTNNDLLSTSNLSALSSLEVSIDISNNPVLTNFDLSAVMTQNIESMRVENNLKLTTGLLPTDVTTINLYLNYFNNPLLTAISEMNSLTSIGQYLQIDSYAGGVFPAFPLLVDIGLTPASGNRGLYLTRNPNVIAIPLFTTFSTVAGDIIINNNNSLPGFDLSGLSTQDMRRMQVQNNPVMTLALMPIDVTALSLDLVYFNNPLLTTISEMDNLTSVGQYLQIDAYAGGVFPAFPLLVDIGLTPASGNRGLYLTRNPAVTAIPVFGAFNEVAGDIIINNNNSLPGFDLSGLSTQDMRRMQVQNNPVMTLALMPIDVTALSLDLVYFNNPLLTTISEMDNLTSVGQYLQIDAYAGGVFPAFPLLVNIGLTPASGNRGLYLTRNPAVTAIPVFGAFNEVAGDIIINNNNSLPSFDLSGLSTQDMRRMQVQNNPVMTLALMPIDVTALSLDLVYFNNPLLTTISEMDNLTSVGQYLQIDAYAGGVFPAFPLLVDIGLTPASGNRGLYLTRNLAVTAIPVFGAFNEVAGDIIINNNNSLPGFDLSGLSTQDMRRMRVANNPVMTSALLPTDVTALSLDLVYSDNPNLILLSEMDELTMIEEYYQVINIGACVLPEFPNLNSIGPAVYMGIQPRGLFISGNQYLSRLPSFSNVTVINQTINITSNPNLSECAIQAVCDYLTGTGDRTITGNTGDCLDEAAVSNHCTNGPTVVAPPIFPIEVIVQRGTTASLVITNLPGGGEAVWYAEDGITELYASTANNFQPMIDHATVFYGAVRQSGAACVDALVPVDVLAYYPLSIQLTNDFANCADASDAGIEAIVCGGCQSIGNGHFKINGERASNANQELGLAQEADLNGDGYLDVIVHGSSFYPEIWWNDGDGTFTNSLTNIGFGGGNDFSSPFPFQLGIADFDSDGDIDLVYPGSSNESGKVMWNDGLGNFSAGPNLPGPSAALTFATIISGDINNDGHVDMVFNRNCNTTFLTNDGVGNFSIGQSFPLTTCAPKVDLADVDNDGFLDYIVAINAQANQIYINDGTGNFNLSTETFGSTGASKSLATGDLNDDGFVDIVTADGNVTVWLNDGTGTFTQTAQNIGIGAGAEIEIADFNRDNIPDLIIGRVGSSSPNSAWVMLGLGDGTFVLSEDLGNLSSWASRIIGVATGDFDRDGDVDIFTSSGTVYYNDNASQIPYTYNWNNGESSAEIQNLTAGDYSLMVTDAIGNVETASVNIPAPDAISVTTNVTPESCSNANNGTAALSASGGLPFVFKEVLEDYPGLNPNSTENLIGDIDGDGDTDVLTITDGPGNANTPLSGDYVWLNDGDGTFTASPEVFTERASRDGGLGDLDGDGDLDVFVTGFTECYVRFNDGDGTFTTGSEFYVFPISSIVGQSWSFDKLADLDGDGDLDAFTFGSNYQVQVIWLNDGDGTFTKMPEEYGGTIQLDVVLGDLDGDGDIDAFLPEAESSTYLLRNDGDATFTKDANAFGEPQSWEDAELADFDGDGDLDAVVCGRSELYIGLVQIYLNDGSGSFTQNQKIRNYKTQPSGLFTAVDAADIDNDGDMDFSVVLRPGGSAYIYLNDGDGNFEQYPLAVGGGNLYDIGLVDLDLDGDMDMIQAANGGMEVYLQQANEYTYQWNAAAGSQTTATATNLSEGTYSVTITDCNNCSIVENVTIGNANLSPAVSAASNAPICAGIDELLLSESGGEAVSWSWTSTTGFTSTEQNPVIANPGPADAGDYTVAITDANGCTNAQTISVVIQPEVSTTLTPDEIITERGASISLMVPGVQAGQEAVWFDEDQVTELYADVANDYQPTIDKAQVFYGAVRNLNTQCLSELVPVNVLAYYPLSVRTEVFNASCSDQNDGAVQAIICGGRQSIGTGNFRISKERYEYSGYRSTIGDFNNDGYPDIYESTYNTYDNVWLNDGDGTFTYQNVNYNSVQLGRNAVVGDFNGDGFLDIYVANSASVSDKVLLNDGTGTFTELPDSYGGLRSQGADVGDVNGDGLLDVVVAGANFVAPLFGNGDGTFSQQASFGNASYSSSDVRLGDLDNDGDLDAFVANGDLNQVATNFNPCKVYLNDGAGNFAEVPEDYGSFESSWEVELGDLNGDGFLDAYISNWELDNNQVYFNDGDGTFTVSAQTFNIAQYGRAAKIADYDRDGDLDVVATHQNGSFQVQAIFWENDGTGFFTNRSLISAPAGGADVGLGDFDRDGDLDLFFNYQWTHILPGNGKLHHILWNDDSPVDPYDLEWNGGSVTSTLVRVGQGAGTYTLDVTDADGNTVSTDYEIMADDPIVLNTSSTPTSCDAASNGTATVTISGGGPFQIEQQGDIFGTAGPGSRNAVLLVDFDNDGDLDFTGGASIGINDGTGNYTEFIDPSYPAGLRVMRAGDLDGDGVQDLVTTNFAVINFYKGNGDFTFQAPVTHNAAVGSYLDDIDLGDLDGDNDLDLFLSDKGSRANQVWLNDGSGNLTASSNLLGSEDTWETALGDLDGDGDLDAFCANLGSGNIIYLNDGAANFTQHFVMPSGIAAHHVDLGDLDGDGDLDAVVDSYGEQTTRIYLNNGDATFTLQPQEIPNLGVFQVKLADFDLDGDLDILTSRLNVPFGNRGGIFWLNNGDATFVEYRINATQNLFLPSSAYALGDIDGNGYTDFVTPASTGHRFWLNKPLEYTYQWDANTGNQTTETAVGLNEGNYNVTVTDFRGCAAITSITVGNSNAFPTVTFTAPADVCIDAGVQTGLGGATPMGGVYSGDGVTDDNNGMTYSFDPALANLGTHTITYSYTDGSGCSESASDDVAVFEAAIANNVELALCEDGTGNATFNLTDAEDPNAASNLASGMGQDVDGGLSVTVTYHTSSPAEMGNQILNPTMYSAFNGATVIALITTADGCATEAIVTLTVFDLPVITFTKVDDTDCLNPNSGSINIMASGGAGGYTFDWTDLSGMTNDENRTNLPAGDYTIIVTDANGCSQTEVITILGANCVAVGNYVFMDNNGNGTFETGTDLPIENVLVELYAAGDTPGVDAARASTMTNATGYYYFDELNTGDYTIYIPGSNFVPAAPLAGKRSAPGADNTDNTDNNDNGLDTPLNGGIVSNIFTLTPNGAPGGEGQTDYPGVLDDDNVNGTIDFAFVTGYQIGSYVWLDINNDGQQIGDFSGAFLNDVALQLIYAGPDGDLNTTADNQIYTTTPEHVNGLNGQYLFNGLVSGTYELSIPNLPSGFAPTTLGVGGDNIDSNDPNGVVFTIPQGGVLPTGEDGVGDMPGGAGYPDTQDNWSFDFGLVTDGYTITCNCDGSITIDWDPFAGGDSWTVTLEDMNGNPALNFVNMPESEVTIAPGSLNNLECYALAITENIGGTEVASIQGYVCDVCYTVPEIVMTGTGPSCLDANDGEVTITITEQGCTATYDVYLTSPGQADMLVGDDIMITAPITVTGLGEGSYGVRLELVDQGSCFYGPNCFPVIEDNLLTLQNTDNTPPTKQVFDASGAEVTDMVFNYDQLPEGECGVQFTWTILLTDACQSAGVGLTASITTSSPNPGVNPSAQVTVLDNAPTYAVEVFAAVGTNTLTLTATDANGNSTDIVYIINVADNRDPVLYCPGSMNIQIPSCEEDIPVNWAVSAVDDCDLEPTLMHTFGPASGDVLTPGMYTATYEATDDYGNVATCSFNINITQALSPEPIIDVSGNGNYTIEHCEESGLIVFYGNVYDCDLDASNFNPADLIVSTTPLSPAAAGVLTISHTLAQDGHLYFEATGFLTAGSYLIVTSYQGVTVDHGVIVSQDTDQPAVVDMPGNLSYQAADCQLEVPVNFSVQVTDDCDNDLSGASFTVNGNPAPPIDAIASDPLNGLYVWNLNLSAGTYALEGTYTDVGGNVSTQEITITVSGTTDDWAPIIVYPAQGITVELDPWDTFPVVVPFEVTATDDCDGDIPDDLNVNTITPYELNVNFNPQVGYELSAGGETYLAEFSSTGIFTVTIDATDAAGNTRIEDFQIIITQEACPEVSLICNDDINVTLNDNCQRVITTDMLLEGSFGCLEEEDFMITINDDDPSNGHFLDGCGEFIYEIDLAPGVGPVAGFEPCWGYITGEDKDDPILECPPNTGTGTIIKNGYTLSGTIDTDDPQVVVNDWSCLIDNTQPNFAGTRYVDVQSFQLSESDVYTFLVESDITQTGNVGFAIYQGGYDVENPCENIIAQADIPQSPGVGNPLPGSQGNDPYVRLALPLQAGVTYYLATTTFTPDATGNYQYSICADGNGQVGYFDTTYVTNPDWSVDEIVNFTPLATSPVTIELLLHCEDFDLIFNNPASLDIVGAPIVSDNCDANPDVTFVDTYTQNGDCGDIVITRIFTATDDKGNSSTCTQIITLSKVIANNGTDTEVWLPPFTVPIECDEDYPTLANGHPTPAVAGYPFVYTVSGIFDLSEGQYCNVGAAYEDGPEIVVCDGTYKFTRTWTIIDWCSPTGFYTYAQIIKVGDFTSPTLSCPGYDYDGDGTLDPLVFSTTPFACTAGFEVPLPEVEDNCSAWEVHTEIRTEVEVDVINEYGAVTGTAIDTITVRIVEWDAPTRFVSGIPVGDHYFYYVVEDDCGNKTEVYCPFSVRDQIEPVAVCDDELLISIAGGDFARVFADEIDEGSWDNCEIDRIEVRRNGFDPINNTCGSTYSEWSEYIDFFCCDVGVEIEIQLRVVDKSGNINTCWLNVIPEEKVRPWCEAPHNVDTDCTDLPYDFDASDTAQLQDLFGMAEATDNCGATAEELPPVVDMDCGFGRIIRRFRATDIHGNQSVNFCQQVVDINEAHNFEIKFPEDAEAICGMAEPDSVTYEEIACDLLAVNHTDEFFSASGNECYKIFRTWKVINWCQYDGEGDPLIIGRDEDCDGNPGDEAVWVLHRPNGYTYIDRDDDETESNNVPLAFQNICQGFDDFWRKVAYDGGYYEYTQIIKVYDDIDPEIIYTEQTFCSYDNVDCDGVVNYPFEVGEECTPDDLTIKVFLDAGADGTIDYNLTESGEFGFSLTGTYPNYTIGGEYPIGCHAFEVHVEDGCGNITAELLPFCVEDCKSPSPICINGLAIELMPFDVDGDDIPDEGRMAIWASDFIASPVDDCTGPVVYSMNRSGEAPNIDSTGIVLTCADTGTLVVEIWAWDGAGNSDFCETYILVQDNMVACTGAGPGIAGAIYTEDQEMVESVQMSLSGQGSANMETAADGLYSFTNLVEGYDYTITPEQDGDYLNGVSTFDLVLISQHILGVAPLDSPYKRIAADANNSESITTLDLIVLRKLILSIDVELANNSSWRFVDADYVFPNPNNPWHEAFPEIRNVNDLSAAGLANVDFIAVKIGDVNGDAQVNSFTAVEGRDVDEFFFFNVDDIEMKAGQEYTVAFSTTDIANIRGYQATLSFGTNAVELVDIISGMAKEENFGFSYLDEGLITTSWHWNSEALAKESIGNSIMFSLVLRASTDAQLSEVLGVSSRITKAEAYNQAWEYLDVAIGFGTHSIANTDKFVLYQNTPNPFSRETLIGFNVPEAGNVKLSITDINGNVIKQILLEPVKGYNAVVLDAAQLPKGMLYYTLKAGAFSDTKQMINLE